MSDPKKSRGRCGIVQVTASRISIPSGDDSANSQWFLELSLAESATEITAPSSARGAVGPGYTATSPNVRFDAQRHTILRPAGPPCDSMHQRNCGRPCAAVCRSRRQGRGVPSALRSLIFGCPAKRSRVPAATPNATGTGRPVECAYLVGRSSACFLAGVPDSRSSAPCPVCLQSSHGSPRIPF